MRRPAVLLLVLLALLGAVAIAGCGGSEEATPTPETVVGELPEAETTTTTETEGGGAAEGDPEAGKEIFASAGCGGCHALEDAGSSGNIGPNLDESQPEFALVVDRVTNGQGAMPAFSGQLSEEDIDNVAAYVVQATGGG